MLTSRWDNLPATDMPHRPSPKPIPGGFRVASAGRYGLGMAFECRQTCFVQARRVAFSATGRLNNAGCNAGVNSGGLCSTAKHRDRRVEGLAHRARLLPFLAAGRSRHPKRLSCFEFRGTARNPDILQARVAETLQLAARAGILPPHDEPMLHVAPAETSAGMN